MKMKTKIFACTITLNILMSQISFASDFEITSLVAVTTIGATINAPEAIIMNISMKFDRRAKEAIIAANLDAYAYSQEPTVEVPAMLSNAIEILNSACPDEAKELFQQLSVQQKAMMVASVGDQLQGL